MALYQHSLYDRRNSGTDARSPKCVDADRAVHKTLSSSATDDIKSYDLVWLLHLVGDLHQPLQATARFSHALDDDRGGNDEVVQVGTGSSTKLHLYLDSLLGEDGTPKRAIDEARNLPAADAALAAISDPGTWIIESFVASLKQWRQIATSYDKLAQNFIGFVKSRKYHDVA